MAQKKKSLSKRFRHLIWLCLRRTQGNLLKWRSRFAYWLWGLEGVNGILYQCNSAHVSDLLIRYGADLGSDCDLNSPLLIHNAIKTYSNLAIGQRCHLGKGILLDLRDKIIIEDQVTVSMGVSILTHTDMGRSPLGERGFPPQQAPVLIKRGAYIGACVTILAGVTIGECSVLGAGAVVVKDVPAYSVAVGIPARIIRSFERERVS